MPEVSVIIPVFNAGATLLRAVESVVAQGYSPQRVEIIIAPDDRGEYSWIRPAWPAMRILPSRYFRTGPGRARNRAMGRACGRYLAFLDADDNWGENYLRGMLAHARRYGASFAPTRVISGDGQVVMTMAAGQRCLSLSDFGVWPGSFHPLLHRELSPGFRDGAAQDVFHAMEVLGRLGGRASLASDTFYGLHLRQGSVTTDPAYSRQVDRQYQRMITVIRAGETGCSAHSRSRAIAALHARRNWNRRWCSSAGHPQGFYGYISSELK